MKKKIASKATMVMLPVIAKILILLLSVLSIVSIFDWVTEIFAGEKTAEAIYEELDIESVKELVQIKGNSQDGYYIDFIDDIDQKLEVIVEKFNEETGYKSFPDSTDFLKKILKSEIYTSFPNLGGKIPDGTDGFQGAITMRRITPNIQNSVAAGEQEVSAKITDLKYIDISIFENYINNSNAEVLNYFSLDDKKQLVTACKSENGYVKNASVDFQTVLQKYTMPYEYLLFFYIDSRSEEFCSQLADEIINSKFIIAVKDEVTKTSTSVETLRKEDANPTNYSKDWYTQGTQNTEVISYSASIEPTYIETWYIKVDKENNFNVNMGKGSSIDTKVKCEISNFTDGPNESEENLVETIKKTVDKTEVTYNIYQKTKTTTNITNISVYSGENNKDPKFIEDKFVKIYQDCKMEGKIIDHRLFKMIENNEKTANLLDLTKYLIYKATGEDYGVSKSDLDFSEYELESFTNISASSGNGGISLTTSMFTKEVFITALTEYGKKGNTNFNINFLPYAGEIYEVSVESGVNPELVIVTAKTEQNFKAGGGNHNYWGVRVTNGSSTGSSFSSLLDGIRGYASVLKSYEKGGKYAASITAKYEDRKNSGCDPLGYGLPGTLSGMQSMYSSLGKHEEGSSGKGGYYYMDPSIAGVTAIYSTHQEFLDKCYNVDGAHAEGVITTPWEQGQYTAWQLNEKIEAWEEIFGAYGTLSAGGDFLVKAEEIWKQVCQEFTSYGGASIPPKTKTIDCSAYVSWVLYEYGYTEFGGWQMSSQTFYNSNFKNKYGWEEIQVDSGQSPIDQLQPGDIFVRYGSGTHHVLIVKEIKDGRLLSYDCGDTSNWIGKGGQPADSTYFLTEVGAGKIIRVTPPK